MTTQTSRLWSIGLIVLMFARLAMSWLLLNDIPRLLFHEGWYFSQGGDQHLYMQVAYSLVAGKSIGTKLGVGVPLIMTALLRLTGKLQYDDILPWLVILNGFVLGSLSVWVMAQLTWTLTRNRWQGFAAAAFWTFSAYALWLVLGIHPEAETLRNAYLPRQLWMNGLTDAPSLFMTMLGLWLAAWATGNSPSSWRRGALFLSSGIVLGLAASLRIHTLAMTGIVMLALLWTRQWRGLILSSLGVLIGLAPQFWYNAIATGHPLNMPYVNEWLGFDREGRFYFSYTTMHFSPQFLLDSLILLTRGRWPLAVVGAAAVVTTGYLFIRCWRQCGGFAASVMFGAPAASLGLHVITYVFVIDPIRFALPALSIGVPAGVWAAFFVISEVRTKLHSRRPFHSLSSRSGN